MSLGDVPNTVNSSLMLARSGVLLLSSLKVRGEGMVPCGGWSAGKKGSPGLEGVTGDSWAGSDSGS